MTNIFLALLIPISIPFGAFGQEVFNTVKYQKNIPLVKIVQSDTVEFEVKSVGQESGEEFGESQEIKKNTGIAGMPLKSITITSSFGKRKDPLTGKIKTHRGIDLRAKEDSVLSILPGIISKVYYHKKLGVTVEIKHGSFTSIYGHLRHTYVNEGSRVMDGQCIGLSGNTGRSSGPHLHFSLKYRGKIVNPLPYLMEIWNQLGFSKE